MANKINGWTVLIIVLLAYAFIVPFRGFVDNLFTGIGGGGATGGTGGGSTGQQGGGVQQIEICDPSAKVTLSTGSNNLFAKGSEITNGSHRVFINGADKGYLAEDGSMTVSPKDTYKVIFGENSTGSYSVIQEGAVPCQGTLDLFASLANYDVSPTITVWNDQGQPLSTTVLQDVDANDKDLISYRIEATSQESVGNQDHPDKGNVLCFAYNKSAYTAVELLGRSKAPVPVAISTGAANTTNCFYIPIVQNDPLKESGKLSDVVYNRRYEGDIQLTASSTFTSDNPGHNVTFRIMDTDIDLHADTLAVLFGAEDEDNNDLGMTNEIWGNIYVS